MAWTLWLRKVKDAPGSVMLLLLDTKVDNPRLLIENHTGLQASQSIWKLYVSG